MPAPASPATFGLAADQTTAASATHVQAQVRAGTLEITGTARADTVTLRLAPGAPTTLQIDVGADGTADFSFDAATFTAIKVDAGPGADAISGSNGLAALGRLTIAGGPGNDTLSGGDGDDALLGGQGNDTVNGNRGNDVALLGAGDDRFTWNPGDGDDTVEGQAGNDVLGFNGSNAAERMDVAANGSRVRLFRDVANVTMDLNAVERLELNALAGADTTPSTTSPAPTSRPPTSTSPPPTAAATPRPTPSSPTAPPATTASGSRAPARRC